MKHVTETLIEYGKNVLEKNNYVSFLYQTGFYEGPDLTLTNSPNVCVIKQEIQRLCNTRKFIKQIIPNCRRDVYFFSSPDHQRIPVLFELNHNASKRIIIIIGSVRTENATSFVMCNNNGIRSVKPIEKKKSI